MSSAYLAVFKYTTRKIMVIHRGKIEKVINLPGSFRQKKQIVQLTVNVTDYQKLWCIV